MVFVFDCLTRKTVVEILERIKKKIELKMKYKKTSIPFCLYATAWFSISKNIIFCLLKWHHIINYNSTLVSISISTVWLELAFLLSRNPIIGNRIHPNKAIYPLILKAGAQESVVSLINPSSIKTRICHI
jgi:hypothetical protein